MGLRVLPQSRLEDSCCLWMCRASIVLLLELFVSIRMTLAACQSTTCCSFHACTAMPFFSSCLFTAALCLLILFSRVLPVSLM